MSPKPTPRDRSAARLAMLGLALAAIAPLMVFAGVAGVRTGAWDWRFGLETLTLTWAWPAAWLGGIGAVIAIVGAVRAPKRAGAVAALAVVVSAATIGVFLMDISKRGGPAAGGDVSTNAGDPPGFAPAIQSQRGARTIDAGTCDIAPVPRQVSPQVAGWALKEAGFDVRGIGVGLADGTKTGFWYDLRHDAVVRIRPGRTDVRVASRQDRDDRGEACRLAQAILAEIQARP